MSSLTGTSKESSISMQSAKRKTKKIPSLLSKRDAFMTTSAPELAKSIPSSSPLADLYKTEQFRAEWANDVAFHVARNVLHLRRYRRMSQSAVAVAMGTSQSAIARIESAQENITLDTLQRLTEALDGRFYVSIYPWEHPMRTPSPWWEPDRTAGWSVVCWATRSCDTSDKLILGFERPHEAGTSSLWPVYAIPQTNAIPGGI
jgi:transcriptional regulator with XRE-family HTH domain